MSSLSMFKVELGLASVVAGGLLLNWLSRATGDEVVTIGKLAREEIRKIGIEDPEVVERLVTEFYQLSEGIPHRPGDDIFFTLAFPIYQIRCYLIERNAIRTIRKKAKAILREKSNLNTR